MGWMSWEIFRAQTDCQQYPTACINAYLYESTADAMVAGGFLAAGYDTVHIDGEHLCFSPIQPAG